MDLPIVLNRESAVPLKRQLYEEIRRLILTGHWPPGHKFPSSRILAEKLDISRPTINWACGQLLAEGYLQSFIGTGTFVNRELPQEFLPAAKRNAKANQIESSLIPPLSHWGNYLLSWPGSDRGTGQVEIDFREAPPSVEHFPINQWRKLLAKYYANDLSTLNYAQDSKGFYPLREAISRYLFRARAIQCNAEQIIIVTGAQQALSLLGRVHLDIGDAIALEDPAYEGARHIFQSTGAQLWPIPVNEGGLDIDTLEALETVKFKLLYLTPSHQVPLGPTLSLDRRLKVLNWAQRTGAIIIEDDYDGEYRYAGRTIPALSALDNGNSVIYVGTFSKALFPSLRIGYLVVPERLVRIYGGAKTLSDNYSAILEQIVLAEFIDNGSLEKYIRRMRKYYEQKRQILVKALEDNFGEAINILGDSAGLYLTARIKTDLNDNAIINQAASLGVGIRTTSRDYLADTYTKSEFFFGYGDVDENLIEEGVKRLAKVILSKVDS